MIGRRVGPVVVCIAAFLTASALAVSDAGACSALPERRSAEQIVREGFETSAAVFIGEVVAVDRFSQTLRVERMWKGEPVSEVVIGRREFVAADGRIWINTCLQGLGQPGARWVVFANANAGTGLMTVSNSGPSVPLLATAGAAEATMAVLDRIVSGRE